MAALVDAPAVVPQLRPQQQIEGRMAHVVVFDSGTADETATAVQYVEGEGYDEIRLGPESMPVVFNSVLLIPGLLNESECVSLIADVERCHDSFVAASSEGEQTAGQAVVQPTHVTPGRARYKIKDLSGESRGIFKRMLHSRLLPFLSTQSEIERHIWTQSLPASQPKGLLKDLTYYFSENEPAINRYVSGGAFEPHADAHACTVNILLAPAAFEGGGTHFWRESVGGSGPELDGAGGLGPPTLCIHPAAAGTGMVWNGSVMHAGAATTEGTRHLLVASFTISARHIFD